MPENPTKHKEKIKILSIETSCDETAVSVIEAGGGLDSPVFKVLGNALYSQIDLHAEYGGVFPMLAKREHGKNLVPLLDKAVSSALENIGTDINNIDSGSTNISSQKKIIHSAIDLKTQKHITDVLDREEGLSQTLLDYLKENINRLSSLDIDYIAVTEGPGLEPALWVGISFAKALSIALDKPLIPINHMEGHIVSVLVDDDAEPATNTREGADQKDTTDKSKKISFPALALLISGGHTELVECTSWNDYKIIGQTVDDAIGEAFDKVARLIGIPYPGGPKISQMAGESRSVSLTKKYIDEHGEKPWSLPRPMIHSKDLNFSFSGIKTAVLYAVRDKLAKKTTASAEAIAGTATDTHNGDTKAVSQSELTEIDKMTLAEEFENAVTEVIIYKTNKALEQTQADTLIVGGGVIANKYIRSELASMISKRHTHVTLRIPTLDMTTDNSVMIGVAGYLKSLSSPGSVLTPSDVENIKSLNAKGGLALG